MRLLTLLLCVGMLLPLGPQVLGQKVKQRAVFRGHTFSVQQVALSADAKVLASGGGDTRGGELKLWDISTRKEIASLPGYTNSLFALAFSADGKLLASGDIGYRVMLWDVEGRECRATFTSQHDWVHSLAFGPDGKKLACAGEKEVKLRDLSSGKEVASFRHPVSAWSMAFTRDLKTLASPNYQDIDLWDVTAGKERLILSEQRGKVGHVSFGGEDRLLAGASVYMDDERQYHGQIKVWDVGSGREQTTLKGRFGWITALALSPNGKTVAVVTTKGVREDGELRILDVATSREILTDKGLGGNDVTISFATDGRFFAVGTADKVITVWEVLLPKPEKK